MCNCTAAKDAELARLKAEVERLTKDSAYEDGQFRLQDVQGDGNVVHWKKSS